MKYILFKDILIQDAVFDWFLWLWQELNLNSPVSLLTLKL